MNSPPPPSQQALFDGLTQASVKFAQDVMASLSSQQRAGSAEMVKSLTAGLHRDAEQFAAIQQRYYQQYLQLWQNLAQSGEGEVSGAPVIAPAKGDRRFHAPEWRQLPYFNYVKQAYLLNSQWLAEIVEALHLDVPTKNKLRFFTRQLIDAAAPANFAPTNPEVIKLAAETNGESLARGLEHLSADIKKGRILMTDEAAFEIGERHGCWDPLWRVADPRSGHDPEGRAPFARGISMF
jgi:polyhydroxyalkanoate synthase